MVEILQKFVAFSEYMKFNCMHYILMISNCCWNKYNQSIFNKPFWRLFAIWFNSGNLMQWPETEILLICWNLHGICQTVAGISNQSIFWRVFGIRFFVQILTTNLWAVIFHESRRYVHVEIRSRIISCPLENQPGHTV